MNDHASAQPNKEVLAAGRFLRLVRREGWEYVERTNATGVVVIVAVTGDGKLVMTEQWRRPVDCRVIELPAGLAGDIAGDEGEQLEAAARRELFEETGYEATTMRRLTEGPTTAGLADEVVTLFRAEGLTKTGAGGGDASEEIIVHEIPLGEAEAWLERRLAAGALVDPKVYAGLYFAEHRG